VETAPINHQREERRHDQDAKGAIVCYALGHAD
jgi:hypothetical protein